MGKTMYCYGMPLLSPAPSREWYSRAKAQNVLEERDTETKRGEKEEGTKKRQVYKAGETISGKMGSIKSEIDPHGV